MNQASTPVADRPVIYLTTTECDALWDLALSAERRDPKSSGLLRTELERAETCEPADLPEQTVVMNSWIDFVDEGSGMQRTVQLVYPWDADISAGRVSVMTPIGVGLIGMRAGHSISWPDRDGHDRLLRIVSVKMDEKG